MPLSRIVSGTISSELPFTFTFFTFKMVLCICVLVQIYKSSPPLDDVPSGLPKVVVSLIECGWTVDKSKRPDVEKLLQHEAFRLLG